MSAEEDHSDDIALAGEYVLRLLDAEAQASFEARLVGDATLRTAVRAWEALLAPLAEDIAPVPVAATVKARIETTLFKNPPKSAPSGIWRWITGALVAVSIVAGALLLSPMLGPQVAQSPTLSASVTSNDGSLVIAARFYAEGTTLQVEREMGTAFPGRVLELWLIAEGAEAPVSLGVLSPETETRISLPQKLAEQLSGAVLAVSDEPPGGSPTGAPTGAVLATGAVSDV